MVRKIDSFLHGITMYRFVLYGLSILATIGFIFSYLHLLPFTPLQMLFSLTIISCVGLAAKLLGSYLYKVPVNVESSLITVLILFLILTPVISMQDAVIVGLATAIAILSKFVLTINKKHLFNPTALGLFIIGLLGFGNSIWWVGSGVLLPFVLLFGLLLLRKIRRFQMFFSYLVVSVIVIAGENILIHMSIIDSVIQVFTSWPVIFLGAVMLTEPSTTPPRRHQMIMYGVIVGIVSGLRFSFGPLYSTPEFALIVGNLYSYAVSQKEKLILTLREVTRLTPAIFEIVFTRPASFSFRPGEYMEWTYAHSPQDSRGIRRMFSIASGPEDETLSFITRLPENASSFKRSLIEAKKGTKIIAGQLAGDFLLPKDTTKKIVLVAGGIGITPILSMINDIVAKKQKRDMVLFYASNTVEDLLFKDFFAGLAKNGIQFVPIITSKDPKWEGESGYISASILKKYLKNPTEWTYYLSGPDAMVDAYKKLLKNMGISSSQLVTDYFPGY